ncbi:MAG: hypothetical protein IPM42_08625 [Saprospiraceae bacterium]|nr:hypothetical protein [Saprospiraceae bacterium]
MQEFNFKEFHENIQKDLLEANRLISDIEPSYYQSHNEYLYEELIFNKERLRSTFELIKLKFDFAHEFLQLLKLSDKLNIELKKYNGNFDQLEYMPFLDVFYSPVKWTFTRHLSALTSHVKINNESEYETTNSFLLLEQILRGTPKILTERKIVPSNEAEVRSEVYRTLIHVFPDTVREIPIAKISKVYKPDIGIRRLKSAIEYKFVDSANEAKTAIGGIFEDIKGYEGSADWTTFYAVIYMTDNFLTQDQIEAEFKLSKVPHHWKPIVVFGKGSRIRNTRKK